ncbi:MAG TPA: chromosomal replication initiator protein DnaA [Candidatus Saccharimonadia bacterium]|nr:chromosomal replication initiator protein DnaA [Candidatus Saccharimonadia bacterium]
MDNTTSVLVAARPAAKIVKFTVENFRAVRYTQSLRRGGVQVQKDAIWQAVLGELEVSLSHGNFVTWFKNTQLLKEDDGHVVIGVNNPFVRQTLEKKYAGLIAETLAKQGVEVKDITYKMLPASAANKQPSGEEPQVASTRPSGQQPSMDRPASSGRRNTRQALNERYTLDSFVVGDGNELAFAACQAIVQQPGTRYNPFYVYGGVGIGKTHLIQAVGNTLHAKNPNANILYIATEQFVQEFVSALRNRTAPDFAHYYRSADVLIVDDVQFLAGKDKIQEEFFHTFNTLHQANKQIILSSDQPPSSIVGLEDRLKSRFGGGMAIDMQIPDFETRCAIVQTKAGNHGSELDNDVVEYLATNIQTNIRELEGALNQLLAFCEMRGLEPSLAIATSLLNVSKTRPKHLSAKQIIERTARHFQIPVEDIVGPKRDKDIVVPRQVAMYMLRNELKLSFPKIARELGRKDHTTAIHSVDKIDKESRTDANLRMAISEIREHLYA